MPFPQIEEQNEEGDEDEQEEYDDSLLDLEFAEKEEEASAAAAAAAPAVKETASKVESDVDASTVSKQEEAIIEEAPEKASAGESPHGAEVSQIEGILDTILGNINKKIEQKRAEHQAALDRVLASKAALDKATAAQHKAAAEITDFAAKVGFGDIISTSSSLHASF